jgi:pfkB family carbohydrate kinase
MLRNDWNAVCWTDGQPYQSRLYPDLEIMDRVGGGDSFVSGLIYGLLTGLEVPTALEYGAAHGAPVMTTPVTPPWRQPPKSLLSSKWERPGPSLASVPGWSWNTRSWILIKAGLTVPGDGVTLALVQDQLSGRGNRNAAHPRPPHRSARCGPLLWGAGPTGVRQRDRKS